jgi:hypothetical protein
MFVKILYKILTTGDVNTVEVVFLKERPEMLRLRPRQVLASGDLIII